MEFGHLVIGQIDHWILARSQLCYQCLSVGFSVTQFHTHEDLRILGVSVTVVELGDRALTNGVTKFAEASGSFGNRHRQQCFSLLAELRALGNVPKAVEIDVGAAIHRNQRFPLYTLTRNVGL